jgi:hypothetical protein
VRRGVAGHGWPIADGVGTTGGYERRDTASTLTIAALDYSWIKAPGLLFFFLKPEWKTQSVEDMVHVISHSTPDKHRSWHVECGCDLSSRQFRGRHGPHRNIKGCLGV